MPKIHLLHIANTLGGSSKCTLPNLGWKKKQKEKSSEWFPYLSFLKKTTLTVSQKSICFLGKACQWVPGDCGCISPTGYISFCCLFSYKTNRKACANGQWCRVLMGIFQKLCVFFPLIISPDPRGCNSVVGHSLRKTHLIYKLLSLYAMKTIWA